MCRSVLMAIGVLVLAVECVAAQEQTVGSRDRCPMEVDQGCDVVRNRLNLIAVIELSPDLASGEVVGTITDAAFDVPTTLAAFGDAFYAVNARFTTPPTPATPYTIVRVTSAR
jgi:hypothetical protein